MPFRDDVGDPFCMVADALADCLYHVSFRRYRPLKLPLSCEVVENVVSGPPDLHREGIVQCWIVQWAT